MITDVENPSTADLASAAQAPKPEHVVDADAMLPTNSPATAAPVSEGEALAPLFQPQETQEFRTTWVTVQTGFVDDPKQAVRKADELVARVMKTLAQSFASERAKLESQVDQTDQASTEDLRMALRRYRSFFQRLLSL